VSVRSIFWLLFGIFWEVITIIFIVVMAFVIVPVVDAFTGSDAEFKGGLSNVMTGPWNAVIESFRSRWIGAKRFAYSIFLGA
jgi:predicted membrane protein